MPPPSPLAIATSSINRLLKEELSYEKELTNQKARLAALQQSDSTNEDEVGNAAFRLRQEVSVLHPFGRERLGKVPVGRGGRFLGIWGGGGIWIMNVDVCVCVV